MIVYILFIILFSLSFLPKIRNQNRLRSLNDRLNDFKFTNLILLIWIAIGFPTRLDFTQMMGDVIGDDKLIDYNSIGFFLISFFLILATRFFRNNSSKTIILFIELLIWLTRYYYFKGGYAMGWGANYPLDLIVLYDIAGIFLRLKLIDNIKEFRFFRKWRIWLIVIVFVSIKIFLLSIPHDLFWETKRIQKKKEITKTLLIGDWTGIVEYDSTWLDTIAKYRLDTISEELKNVFEFGADRTQIDSTHKFAFKEMSKSIQSTANISVENDLIISSKSPNCKMDFNYYDWGDLIQSGSLHYGSFKIWRIENDSLIITITEGFGTDYKYKLIRK